MQTLENTTIIDLTRLLPGPLATNLLAQLGARVIKVEHPERSDMARSQPPLKNGESTLFGALNFGKEIRQINYTEEAGRRDLMALVREADVVIEQFRPGRMAQWGLRYEDLKAVKEDLIYVSLSGYGQDGPYRYYPGHDLNYLAYSGILGLSRDQQGRPVIPGVQIADIAGGSYLVVTACLSALLQRERTGRGSRVDVGMLDGLLPLLAVPATQLWGGFDPSQMNPLGGALVNYNVYECADGRWVALAALEIKFWKNFCELVDRPDWMRTNHLELSAFVFPKGEIEALFKEKTQQEWVEFTKGKEVCLSPVRSLEEVEKDPHIRHRGGIMTVESPGGNEMKGFRLPWREVE